ncbi:MAG: pyroglutamyl-peptidase I [Planctomycetota bacterium]
MKMLVAGFEPFGKFKNNPSQALVQELKQQGLCESLLLKTEYRSSVSKLLKIMEQIHPDILLMTGLAAGIPKLHLERFAVNLNDCTLKDNAGEKRLNRPIQSQSPLAYPSTLPLKPILSELKKQSIPAAISNSAGTFICNHIFYSILSHLQQKSSPRYTGFIHMPCSPQQICKENLTLPSMSTDLIVRAVKIIQDVCEQDSKKNRSASVSP